MVRNKAVLCILDGWGESDGIPENAVLSARTPCYDDLVRQYPSCLIEASGAAVGLPTGQIGNSEVGHTNIGAGRVVSQILQQIDQALLTNKPATNPVLARVFARLAQNGGRLHLFGLLSSGRVHCCHRHLIALARAAGQADVAVWVHGIGDGRDSAPCSLLEVLDELTQKAPEAQLATLIGRYYAMDRDRRWQRTERAWRLLHGEGETVASVGAAIEAYYQKGIRDEFLPPIRVHPAYSGIGENDVLLCCQYRTDRVRQIVSSLTEADFNHFDCSNRQRYAEIISMVPYGTLATTPLFERKQIDGTLGQALADANLRQLRVAETEKYPHVTYFLNGGIEQPLPGEERLLVASPKVDSYDQAPEMSAAAISDRVLENLNEDFALIVINYANPDMVGHTGDFDATVQAVEVTDQQLARIIPAALAQQYSVFVVADHGNAECMWNTRRNVAHTAHTTNLVRLIAITPDKTFPALNNGRLGDIAPTLLDWMGLTPPPEMTGNRLEKSH